MHISTTDLNITSITTILNSLNAAVYVSDMETYEMIFMNSFGERNWGGWKGKRCWQVLQADQGGPCSFCNNHLLKGSEGQPTGLHIWEFKNTVTNQWFECHDQAIPWTDGRIVRIEIAFDITQRKQLEADLKEAHRQADRLARIDPLTDLRNRRAFFDEAELLFKQGRRHGRAITAVMIDIDHFKRINDVHGHFTGDDVLRRVARTITRSLRESDLAGRIGGEEFGLVLPETELNAAQNICERIRSAVANIQFEVDGAILQVTCSIGLASDFSEFQGAGELLVLADKALYKAKKLGRNRAVCYAEFDNT